MKPAIVRWADAYVSPGFEEGNIVFVEIFNSRSSQWYIRKCDSIEDKSQVLIKGFILDWDEVPNPEAPLWKLIE